MAIDKTTKLLPYTIHVSSGHYFPVLVPFEFVADLWEEVKGQKKKKVGELECVCINVAKKAFFRFIDAAEIISIDDDQERKECTLEELDMDARELRTRNAQKKADKTLKDAKNKLSQTAAKRSF